MSHYLVCSKVNLASMKDSLNYRKPNNIQRYIYVGDNKLVEMEAIRYFRLLMCTIFYLDLKDTFVVSSFRRNLILVSYLDKSDYLCSFGNNMFKLSFYSNIVVTSSLMSHNNLYLIDIKQDWIFPTLQSYLWNLHHRLS